MRTPSIFSTLWMLVNELDAYVITMPPGPDADRLESIVRRLDDAIERTIRLEQPAPPEEEDAGESPL